MKNDSENWKLNTNVINFPLPKVNMFTMYVNAGIHDADVSSTANELLQIAYFPFVSMVSGVVIGMETVRCVSVYNHTCVHVVWEHQQN